MIIVKEEENMKRFIGIIVSFALILSILFVETNQVKADNTRIATLTLVEGTVEIQKSGGKRVLVGYKNMTLNEGDIVTTKNNSSAILTFSNGTSIDDQIILESNTTISLTKLTNSNETVTKVILKRGKAWVDVNSIKQKMDQFILETPTENIEVRGTNFFIGVDPNTSQAVVALFSGIVAYNANQGDANSTQYIYPSQIFYYDTNEENREIGMTNQSLEQLLDNSSPEVLNAIIATLKKINDENEEMKKKFLNQQNNSDLLGADADNILTNLDRLAYALLEALKKTNKISEEDYLLMQAKLTDSNNVPNSELNGDERANQAFSDALKLKNQEMLDRLKKEEELKNELKAKQQALEEQRKKQEEKLKQLALEKYLNSLTLEEREAYLARMNENQNGQQSPPTQGQTSPALPNPTPTSSWEDYGLPMQLILGEGENERTLELSYNASSDSYHLQQPLDIENHNMFKVVPKFTDVLDVQALLVNFEERQLNGEGAIYEINFESGTYNYQLEYRVSHKALGNKTFVVNLELSQPNLSWMDVNQPFDITFDNNGLTNTISYEFNAIENPDKWLANLITSQYSVQGNTKLHIVPNVGFSISNVFFNGEPLDGTEDIDIEEPIEEMNDTLTFLVEHERYGSIQVTLNLPFIQENTLSFQIFKGLSSQIAIN